MKHQVLIVDDIPSNLNFLSEVLHQEGIGILIATSGKDALQIAKQKLPDLILLDIAMPVMDGFEVCQKLKEDPLTSDIAVMYLTARTEPEDIIQGFETGAVDYILKPFNAAELIARVKTQLELKEKSEAVRAMNVVLEEQVRKRTAELTQSNQSLKDSNKKLEKAYKELSLLDQAKDEFIRHINHELRTPLQGIHGFTIILEEMASTPEQKEYIQAINGLVKRLVKVSEITLLITEIRASNYKLTLDAVSLNDAVQNALENVSGHGSKINIFSDQSLMVHVDKKLLLIALEQLIDNALKYSDDEDQVEVRIFQQDSVPSIEIRDNGPGFSKKALEHLYEMFSADNLKYRSHGFGIGLATARTMLNAISADLEISNLPEKGASVKVTFPS